MKRPILCIAGVLVLFTAALAQSAPEAPTLAPHAEAITLPRGTHMLLKLVSPLHTTSATAGSGVYLETAAPVIVDNQVVIPEHAKVSGVVEDSRRPGRVKGRSRLHLNFTDLILPDNRTFSITGSLQGLPGSSRHRTVDAEGTIEPVDQIDRDVKGVVMGALPGTLLGALGAGRDPALRLGLLGGGLGLAKAMFTPGDEIALPVGTTIEMVLQKSLQIEPNKPSTSNHVADANQIRQNAGGQSCEHCNTQSWD